MEPGPLISGRLHLQVIERARMLLFQFFGAVSDETAVSATDLYCCLYDRDVNKEEDKRSTLINFRQTMLDVQYIRHVVGPNNEIKTWTMVIGTSTNGFRFQEDHGYGEDANMKTRCELKYEFIEDEIEGWIREY